MAGGFTNNPGQRGILRVTVKMTGMEPVVIRWHSGNVLLQHIDVPAGTDRALLLDCTAVQLDSFVAFCSNVEGVVVGTTSNVSAPTTSTPTFYDTVLRPFTVISQAGGQVFGAYPGVVIRNDTAYDARVTIIYASAPYV